MRPASAEGFFFESSSGTHLLFEHDSPGKRFALDASEKGFSLFAITPQSPKNFRDNVSFELFIAIGAARLPY
jgi:hypothetical protein